jgi:hypothetical protein
LHARCCPDRSSDVANEAYLRRLNGIIGSDAAARERPMEEAVVHLGEMALAKQLAPTSPLAKVFERIKVVLTGKRGTRRARRIWRRRVGRRLPPWSACTMAVIPGLRRASPLWMSLNRAYAEGYAKKGGHTDGQVGTSMCRPIIRLLPGTTPTRASPRMPKCWNAPAPTLCFR